MIVQRLLYLKLTSILILTGLCVGAVWIERVQMKSARLRQLSNYLTQLSRQNKEIGALIRAKKYALAIAKCREYVALTVREKGTSADNMFELAWHCYELGLAKECIQVSQEFYLTATPSGKATALDCIAMCRIAMGDFESAKKAQTEARTLDRSSWRDYRICMLDGDNDEAVRRIIDSRMRPPAAALYIELANLEGGNPTMAMDLSRRLVAFWQDDELMEMQFASRCMESKGYPECAQFLDNKLHHIQSMTGILQPAHCHTQK